MIILIPIQTHLFSGPRIWKKIRNQFNRGIKVNPHQTESDVTGPRCHDRLRFGNETSLRHLFRDANDRRCHFSRQDVHATETALCYCACLKKSGNISLFFNHVNPRCRKNYRARHGKGKYRECRKGCWVYAERPRKRRNNIYPAFRRKRISTRLNEAHFTPLLDPPQLVNDTKCSRTRTCGDQVRCKQV